MKGQEGMRDPRLDPSYDMTSEILENSNPEYAEEMEELGKGIAAVRLHPLSFLPPVSGTTIDRLRNGHHIEGSFTSEPPTVYFQIPDVIWGQVRRGDLFRIWGWGWPGAFGASLTFSVVFSDTATPCRMSIPSQAEEMLQSLRPGVFRAVFLKSLKPFAAYDVDMTAPAAMKALTKHLDAVADWSPGIYDDTEAHYWEVVGMQSSFVKTLTPADNLSLSWIRRYTLEARVTRDWLTDLSQRAPYPLGTEGLSPKLTRVYELVAAAGYDVGAILRAFNELLGDVI